MGVHLHQLKPIPRGVDVGLYDYAAVDADDIKHQQVVLDRRCRRRIAPLLGIRKGMGRTEDMAMGVTGAGRCLELWRRRIGVRRHANPESRIHKSGLPLWCGLRRVGIVASGVVHNCGEFDLDVITRIDFRALGVARRPIVLIGKHVEPGVVDEFTGPLIAE